MPGEPSPLHTYVIVGPQGLAYVGLHESERDAWRTYLGWPTVGEVMEKIRAGWYCAQASVTWQKPEVKNDR